MSAHIGVTPDPGRGDGIASPATASPSPSPAAARPLGADRRSTTGTGSRPPGTSGATGRADGSRARQCHRPYGTRIAQKTLVVLGLALLLAACGSSDSSSSSGSADITISDAWARAVPADSAATVTNAVYFVIENDGDAADRLTGVATDIAEAAEMHQTKLDSGVMQMRQMQEVELPAGATVAFEPGGLHVMLIGLTRSLNAGETFQLALTFESTGEMSIDVEVRDL